MNFLIFCLLALGLKSGFGWENPPGVDSADYCYPDQVHIALGDAYYNTISPSLINNPNNSNATMAITWQTQALCDNNYLVIEAVDGSFTQTIHHEDLWNEFLSETISKDKNKIGVEGKYESHSHTALISKLEVGKKYRYKILQTNGTQQAGPFVFKVPELSPKSSKFRFAIYGDIDTIKTNTTLDRLKLMQNSDSSFLDFQIFVGDLGYDIFSENGKRGEYFYNTAQSLLSVSPFMVTPGNHEIYKNYTFFNFRNRMPLYNQTGNHYFSFNVGKIHFISVNYYWVDDDKNQMEPFLNWLKSDLEAANATREERPWIIVFTHQPTYCSSSNQEKVHHRCNVLSEKNQMYGELYYKYRVDFVMAGHIHLWERTGPVVNNQKQPYFTWSEEKKAHYIINPQAPIYTVEGASENSHYMENEPDGLEDFSIKYDLTIGFSTITLLNDSAILYEHIASETGKVIDYFYLLKGDEYFLKPQDPWVKNPIFWMIAGFFLILAILVSIKIMKTFRAKGENLKHSLMSEMQPQVTRNGMGTYEV